LPVSFPVQIIYCIVSYRNLVTGGIIDEVRFYLTFHLQQQKKKQHSLAVNKHKQI